MIWVGKDPRGSHSPAQGVLCARTREPRVWKTLGQIVESRDGGGRVKEDILPSSLSSVLYLLDVSIGKEPRRSNDPKFPQPNPPH